MSPLPRWLILRLEAPLISFGGVIVDQIGVTRDFPAVSMLTGLLANALGWERGDRQAHQHLQDRLVFAVRRDREAPAGVLTDAQNVQLSYEPGWTTRGIPESRGGAKQIAPHRRLRDYHPDACVTVALRLDPEQDEPTLERLAEVLDRPARPLFFGRKPCLPSAPILFEQIEAESAYEALRHVPPVESGSLNCRALWTFGNGPTSGKWVDRIYDLADLRNWKTGLHGGTRRVVEGRIQLLGDCR